MSTRGNGPGPGASGRGGAGNDGDRGRPETETETASEGTTGGTTGAERVTEGTAETAIETVTAPAPAPAPTPAPASLPASASPSRVVRADRRLPDQDADIPLPSIPSPRLGGVPRDRAEHRAEIHRRFEVLAECEPDSVRHRTLRDELIAEHMNYARYVASRFSVPADTAEDLEQVAYLALIKAVDNFDPARGTAFLGYLTPMVAGEIKRYFRDSTWDVHVPRRMQELSLALHGAPAEQLERRLGRSPTIAELAEHLGAQPEEIVEAFDASAAYSATSLERPLVPGDEQGASLGETLGGDDDAYEWVVDREALKPLLAALPEKDKRILLMRFFRGMTQSQIGTELGVSQMQVSRYLTRILGTLRDAVLVEDGDEEPGKP